MGIGEVGDGYVSYTFYVYESVETITLTAHFDGEHLVPDEAVDLPRDKPLTILVRVPKEPTKEQRLAALQRMFGHIDVSHFERMPEFRREDAYPDE